jgi:hypothetical protein
MLGAWPITLDPIFSGLAWSLIFGLVASTAFTLVVVPVGLFAMHVRKEQGEVTTWPAGPEPREAVGRR